MVQCSPGHFDQAFGALSDATRRDVLEALGRGDASITALAERFQMTLTGMQKHVRVLEHAGLVTTEKVGRVRTCRLGKRGLHEEAAWLEQYRLVFLHGDTPMAFFGTYTDVTPPSRLVWTNEEGDLGETVTTVTFEEQHGRTLVVVRDLYPSEEAVDTGASAAMPETFDQLDELLARLVVETETARILTSED
ncbi:ArsR/SmtB family transcription factor [Gemmatimonas sp.]|jgi:DNA-binding transcriptional ArsR family regulator|uniref:ArsR/SmtB family transcription factor n=1 Tax=Gemmatimonas sp. TaxID=1962908 RepID=UPI003DA49D5B